jgi:hypothetical protein
MTNDKLPERWNSDTVFNQGTGGPPAASYSSEETAASDDTTAAQVGEELQQRQAGSAPASQLAS